MALQVQIGRATGHPLALHEREGRRDVERIVSYRDGGFDHLGIAEHIVPVVEMIHLDPAAFLDDRGAFDRGWAGCFQKAVVVGDTAVFSLTSLLPSPQVRCLWRHTDAAMLVLVIDLISILAQVGVKIREYPESMMFWINGAGQQARPLRCLRIPQ